MKYYLQTKNDKILSYSNLPVMDADIVNLEVNKATYDDYINIPEKYYLENGVLKSKTNEEIEEEEFNKQFFNTTLGYVRRSVTMKDGSKKEFLTDILPMLVVGVPVLVYDRQLHQTRVQVTEVFINECKQQLFKDFYGEE